MIQFLSDNIEQLDLALDQLIVCDRNFDRFALMLVDNVVELTLHRFIQDRASINALWESCDRPKYDPAVIKKGLGQNFDSKAKAANKLGLFDQKLRDSILNLHSFRNSSYHKGIRHEGILHSLAIFYFKCACEVLKSYKPALWGWSSNDKVSYRARKYLGDISYITHKEFIAAFVRLNDVISSIDNTLICDLTDDMEKTINSTEQNVNFLCTEGSSVKSRDHVVYEANGPSVRLDPLPSWKARLNSLTTEKDEHKALKKYCDFMKQTETIRSNINESAFLLEGYLQQQFDLMRGK